MLQRFESEKLIRRDGSAWAITNLGAILFAKELDQFDRLGRKAPRVIHYDGTSKLKTKLDRPGNKGYAVGFQGLVGFINGLVPSNEVIEKALRREVKMFPEIAVRELVANALIHQDFTESGTSVMIELYDDRMEISNPGKSFIAPDRFMMSTSRVTSASPTSCVARASAKRRAAAWTRWWHSAEAFQLPAPDFRTGDRRTSVVLFAHTELEQMDRNDRVRASYQHCCLRYVMNEKMTNQSLRERFKLPEDKAATVSQ